MSTHGSEPGEYRGGGYNDTGEQTCNLCGADLTGRSVAAHFRNECEVIESIREELNRREP